MRNKPTQFAILQKNSGLTRAEFAKMLGISFSYAEKLMYGRKKPSAAILLKIKKLFPETDINLFLTEICTESEV